MVVDERALAGVDPSNARKVRFARSKLFEAEIFRFDIDVKIEKDWHLGLLIDVNDLKLDISTDLDDEKPRIRNLFFSAGTKINGKIVLSSLTSSTAREAFS